MGALGANVSATTTAEALKAEVVFLAIPFAAVEAVVAAAGDWRGRIVVDATNAVSFPSFTPMDLGERLSSEIVAEAVGGARLVKAFNTIPAAILEQPPNVGGGRRVVFLSGEHEEANASIAELVGRLGFAPVNLGRLREGGRPQQFGGALVALDLIRRE